MHGDSAEALFRSIADDLSRSPGVELSPPGRGFGSNALRVQGRIFAMTRHGALVVRLSRSRVDELIAAGDGVPFTAGKSRPMAGWLGVPTAARSRWRGLVEEALEHTQ